MTESVHLGSVAVVDQDGRLVASLGDPRRATFARSSMKPLQAAVSLTLAAEDLTEEQVAVMSASHNGEPVHLDAVSAILDRAGLGWDALRTPPDLPLDEEAARAVAGPRPELHNCSGKHAGMLLACVRRGYDIDGYQRPDHPLQESVLQSVRELAGEPEAVGVDGCGVPVHALSLISLAGLYAGLTAGRVDGAHRAVRAMRAKPYLVAGRGRVCTAVMERFPGVIVKVGAEGLICAAAVERRLGIAIKIEDGSVRPLAPAILRVLRLLGLLEAEPQEELEEFAHPVVLGGGHPVGELRADFELAS
ncbi:MAG: asparaginase [Actinomycetota bacterium]|nr:asparaginase [Actinomycetota bacterium]